MQFLNRITAQSLMTRFNDLLYAIYRLKKQIPGPSPRALSKSLLGQSHDRSRSMLPLATLGYTFRG
jgi:hypothetical protein